MSTKPEESDLLASLKAALGGKGVKEAREAAEAQDAPVAADKATARPAEEKAPASGGAAVPAAPPAPPAPPRAAAPAAPAAEAAEAEAVVTGTADGEEPEALSPEEAQAAEERARFLAALRSCEDILNATTPEER